jgi:hypothetical protein
MSEEKPGTMLISLESLEILERRRAEIEQRSNDLGDDRYVTANDRVLFAVLLQQLRSAHELNAQLIRTIVRLDKLEQDRSDDREIVNAIMRDLGNTRRLVIEHDEQIQILATTLDVAFNKLSDVIAQAEQQARDLKEEASLRDH